MAETVGTPQNMKKQNVDLIFHALIDMGTATRSEIAAATEISVTTVRTLLDELLLSGDVIETSLDQSTGGRRATRYALNNNTNHILALYYLEEQIVYRVCSLAGEILYEGAEQKSVYESEQHLFDLVNSLAANWQISAIGLGVPGIVDNKNYINRLDLNTWDTHEIGAKLQNAYGLPIVLENDLNAMAAGYACLLGDAQVDMVYLQFNDSCVCAGLMAGGQIIRGAMRFAGEFSYIPYNSDKTLVDALHASTNQAQLLSVISHTLNILSCTTNPSLVVLGGERLQDAGEDIIQAIQQYMDKEIPRRNQPEIVLRRDSREDYLLGLTQLSIEHSIETKLNHYGSDEHGKH